MPTNNLDGALSDLRILQVGDQPSTFALRILSDLGAETTLVIPKDSSPMTHTAETQTNHYLSRVRIVHVDDVATFVSDEIDYDVVINACPSDCGVPALKDADTERIRNTQPDTIICNISPYGSFGPWAGHSATDLTLLASGGFLGSCGYDDGEEAGLPIAATGGQSNHVTGMIAAMSILGAVLGQDNNTDLSNSSIDISAQHSLAVTTEMSIPYWDYTGQEVNRHTGRHAMPQDTPRWQHPCQDGKYLLALPLYIDDRRFEALKEWMESEGFEHGLTDEKYDLSATRELHMFDVVDAIRRFASERNSGWLFIEAQKRKLPWAPINTAIECVQDSQFTTFRSSIETVSGYSGEPIRRARLPFLIKQIEN